MRTAIYVDGFNLYYGSLRKTQYKWLDLPCLFDRLLPGRNIAYIRYFTARVTPRPHDKQAPVRQDAYLHVVRSMPNVTLHEGHFVDRETLLPQFPFAYRNAVYPTDPPQNVQVMRSEEKKTDVNIATWLLVDGYEDMFDEAILVSNDSDLVLPIEMAITKLGKQVGIINPQKRGKVSRHLEKVAPVLLREINKSAMRACQLPDPVILPNGRKVYKPASW